MNIYNHPAYRRDNFIRITITILTNLAFSLNQPRNTIRNLVFSSKSKKCIKKVLIT